MTIPWMMNCEHIGDGWCLECVGKLWAENQQLKEKIEDLKDYLQERNEARDRSSDDYN